MFLKLGITQLFLSKKLKQFFWFLGEYLLAEVSDRVEVLEK